MKLKGTEPWLVAGRQGATVWASKNMSGDYWWPIVHVEMDCGLITIDVCGMPEVWDLDDATRLRVDGGPEIEREDFTNA